MAHLEITTLDSALEKILKDLSVPLEFQTEIIDIIYQIFNGHDYSVINPPS